MIKKRRWTTRAAAALAVIMLAGSMMPKPVQTVKAADEKSDDIKVEVKVPDNKVPTYEYRKKKDFVLEIQNKEDYAIEDFVIEPDLKGDDETKWPFKTDYQSYSQKIDKLEKDSSKKIKFQFIEKDNSKTTRYTLYFTYKYKVDGEEGKETKTATKAFYINTTKKPEEKKPDNNAEGGNSGGSDIGGGGSFDNGDFSGGGSGAEGGDGSVPRVIVTGFDTKPKEVKAGSDFTLTVHLKNTSKKSRVKNMLFDLNAPEEGDEGTSAPSFLPSSGSSTVYLDGIKANGTADISMKLNAKSDLVQKPYSVELSMKYEDASSTAVEANSSLSIPVKQDARFEFSDFELTPESIAVDDEANVMCSLYNLGKIKLYNVKAIFEGDCIDREEVFVGNVESGATASIDAMLRGTQPTEGPETITMTMSYEDEEGEVSTSVQELSIEVTEGSEGAMEMEEPMEEPKKGLPIIPIIIAVVAIAAGTASVVVLKKRKKRKSIDEEEDLLDELDRTSEDERE